MPPERASPSRSEASAWQTSLSRHSAKHAQTPRVHRVARAGGATLIDERSAFTASHLVWPHILSPRGMADACERPARCVARRETLVRFQFDDVVGSIGFSRFSRFY